VCCQFVRYRRANFEGPRAGDRRHFIGVAADGTTAFSGAMNARASELGSAAPDRTQRHLERGPERRCPWLPGQTAVFLNHTSAGSTEATLNSSDNCVQGNGAGVGPASASN
jgi:hypothetical protein